MNVITKLCNWLSLIIMYSTSFTSSVQDDGIIMNGWLRMVGYGFKWYGIGMVAGIIFIILWICENHVFLILLGFLGCCFFFLLVLLTLVIFLFLLTFGCAIDMVVIFFVSNFDEDGVYYSSWSLFIFHNISFSWFWFLSSSLLIQFVCCLCLITNFTRFCCFCFLF